MHNEYGVACGYEKISIVVNRENKKNHKYILREMYLSRAREFAGRKGWSLDVDGLGFERDAYDTEDATYVIIAKRGRFGNLEHIASTRLLPTTGATMFKDVFGHIVQDEEAYGVHSWETTRLFAEPGSGLHSLSAVMMAGMQFGMANDIRQFVSITPPNMARAFSFCGWRPKIIGKGRTKEGVVYACKWPINHSSKSRLLAKLQGVTSDEIQSAA